MVDNLVNKVHRVIESCETLEQLLVARCYVLLAIRRVQKTEQPQRAYNLSITMWNSYSNKEVHHG